MPSSHDEVLGAEHLDLDVTTTLSGDGGADVITIAVSGEVDLANAARLGAAGREALLASPHELVIDLREVSFMDSSGLGHLTRVLQAARPARTHVLVSHPRVVRLLDITGVTSAYDVRRAAAQGGAEPAEAG